MAFRILHFYFTEKRFASFTRGLYIKKNCIKELCKNHSEISLIKLNGISAEKDCL